MSVRAFAAHLGMAVASVTNWEQRGERIRLRDETQEILDRDLGQAPDHVRERFEAALGRVPAASISPLGSDGAWRLEHALASPSRTDLATVAFLREQVAELDAEYDRASSASLLGSAGQRHGQIAFLLTRAGDSFVRRELLVSSAESAILMGQLVWDAPLRQDHAAALSYFDSAVQAADPCGERVAACRASNVLAGLALLHVAEAHANLANRRPFYLLDPTKLPAPPTQAASHQIAATVAPAVAIDEMPVLDLVVCGSVAVNADGARIGKGAGYSDLGFALLAEAGLVGPHTTIVTTVHPLQIIDGSLPETEHDFRVDAVITPARIIACARSRRPEGVLWDHLPRDKIAAIPALADRAFHRRDGEAEWR